MNGFKKTERDTKSNRKVAVAGSDRDFWGYTCILLGAIFTVAAILLFVFSNRMNFFAQKVSATVIARSDITTDLGEQKQMLTVSYRVGKENVVTSFEYKNGFLKEDVVNIDIYYDVKNPRFIIDDGWSFYPLPVLVLGVMILLIGLCIKGFIFHELRLFDDMPPKFATKYQREVYAVKKKSIENLIPFTAAILLLACGIVFIITKSGWGAYVFVGLGAIGSLYIGLELFPALYEWRKKYKISRIKIKVTDIETEEISSEKIN